MTVPQAEHVHVELDPAAVLKAFVQHRRRFAASVADLDASALSVQSRCSEWTNADVLRHCADVDEWLQAFWTGGPYPFTAFDPRTTPHEFVLAGRSMSDVEARDRYVASTEMMATDLASSGTDRWGLPSISPIGAVPWWLSALHIFYDSWLHERDIFLPLGVEPPVEGNESVPVLAYCLALAGTTIKEATDVTVSGVRLVAVKGLITSTPVDPDPNCAPVTDALSGRGPLEDALANEDPSVVQRLGGLSEFLAPA